MATGSKSHYLANKQVNDGLAGQSFSPSAVLYLGLWQSALDASASGQTPGELAGGGYARVPVTGNTTNWRTGVSGQAYNLVDFVFPTATGLQGTGAYGALLDAATNGNIYYWWPLATAKVIASGDVFRYPSGALEIGESV